jgi:uncharacterized membrane protein
VGDTAAARTAALVASYSVGASFMPGLLARSTRDQVVATGVTSALQFGLVMSARARHHAVAKVIVGARKPGTDPTLAVETAVSAAIAASGYALYRALPQHDGERIGRAFIRTGGLRAARLGAASVVVMAGEAVERQYGEKYPAARILGAGVGVLAGGVIAAYFINEVRKPDAAVQAAHQAAVDPFTGKAVESGRFGNVENPSFATSLALGLGVSLGLQLVASAEGLAAGAVAAGVRRVAPGADAVAGAIGHTVVLGAIGAGVVAGLEYVNRSAEAGGAAVDALYTTAPESPAVSGGPNSQIPWQTLSREGVRFVATALSRDEIAEVTGAPLESIKDPVRAFAGLETAENIDVRVDQLMADLERLGAWERSVLCFASPTGTGYLNYVAVEALEYFTRGDCTTVGLQYSLRPSFLSLNRVDEGREQNRAFLHALVWRIRSLPAEKQPRLIGFGESLGAHTLQDCFLNEGVSGFHRVGMESALFLGTPAGSAWAQRWRANPESLDPAGETIEVSNFQEWSDAVAERGSKPKFVLLSHHEDPIVHFGPALAWQCPKWLSRREERPPGVPQTSIWMPYTSFILTLIDVLNATDFLPGVFVARGHDYRADIARFVAATYSFDASDDELARIESALRAREASLVERRLVAEQFAQATEAVNRQLRSFGIQSSIGPTGSVIAVPSVSVNAELKPADV